jgi:FkbH-like protein
MSDKQELTYNEIQQFLKQHDVNALPVIKYSVIRNIVVEPVLEKYLKYFSLLSGFNAEITFGEYDNIFQEAVGGREDLLNSSTECVLVFLSIETFSWNLSRNFMMLSETEISEEKSRIYDYIQNVLIGIRRQTKAMILWHSFEMPVFPATGIIDNQGDGYQIGVIKDLNNYLLKLLRETPGAYCVDMNICIARIGAKNFYDMRYWHIGHAPYSQEACMEICKEEIKFIRALKGKSKKCLVVDCDNVLWGGIIGEDGLPGIKLGKTYPGSAYYDLQQEIISLYYRGVIISLCSKNNEEDVWKVFKEHPDMLLKEKHIAAYRINWHDKASNIKAIANDLNIGLDSILFIDDSGHEIELVNQLLPQVETIHFNPKKAVEYREILASCGLFDTLSLTSEDKVRGEMYKSEVERKKYAKTSMDMDSYYKSLEMEITIKHADEFSIPRIAQLTQKTNQFNLTTKRYSDADIEDLAQNEDSDVLYLQLRDKFGDIGIVGVLIVIYEGDKIIIDTFLLSCRALGRKVEEVFLDHCFMLAKVKGSGVVEGSYLPSEKNGQVKNFYERCGFETIKENESIQIAACSTEKFIFQGDSIYKSVYSDILQE